RVCWPPCIPARTASMSEFDFDLLVVGAGPAGVRASRMAAGFGARAAGPEELALGGACATVGWVPKQLFAFPAPFAEDVEDARGYGWDLKVESFNWQRLVENKNTEITRLNGIYHNLLTGAGVTLIHGRARLLDSHTVAVGDKRFTSERILLATGGWP